MSKQSNNLVADYAVADFKDRTRHAPLDTSVSNSLGAAIRTSGKFDREISKAERDAEKVKRIREKNLAAFEARDFQGMTYGFLDYIWKLNRGGKGERAEVAKAAAEELDRRDGRKAEAEAKAKAKAKAKQDVIEARNDAAWKASPRDFTKMTHGFLAKLAKKDEEFMKMLRDKKGYDVSSFDAFDAGFEIQRREQVRKDRAEKLVSRLDRLSESTEAGAAEEHARLTAELNKLEGVTEAAGEW